MPRRLNLLFLSTGSACRALMAEAWARTLAGDALHCESAALGDSQYPLLAEQILHEVGLETADLTYRRLDEVMTRRADLVVLLGEWGDTRSVALPNGAGRIDWHLPLVSGGDALAGLRMTRDMVRLKVAGLLKELGIKESGIAILPEAANIALARLGLPAAGVQAPAAALTAAAI